MKVRRATAADAALLERLLPEGSARSGVCRRLVAESEAGEPAGAAILGLGAWGSWVDLEALSPEAAPALEAAVEAAARERGASTLQAVVPCPAGGARDRLYGSLGYDRRLETERWRMDLARALPGAVAYCERLRVPPQARVAPLADAPLHAVAGLRRRFLGGDQGGIERLLRDPSLPEAYDPALCRVLLYGEDLAAIWLARPLAPDAAFVEALAVAPRYRGRWAMPRMALAGIAAAAEAGKAFLEMEIEVGNTLLRRVPARVGGEPIARLARLSKGLEPAPPPEAPERPILAVVGYPRAGAAEVAGLLGELGLRPAPATTDGWLRKLPVDPQFWRHASGNFFLIAPPLFRSLSRNRYLRVISVEPGKDRSIPRLRLPEPALRVPALLVTEEEIRADTGAIRVALASFLSTTTLLPGFHAP
ncbi:MAG: hypothetical protein GC160_11810 [Acidobacteria bacterium]|nr:hypothetical protein [Acidobacteriota bacterium]